MFFHFSALPSKASGSLIFASLVALLIVSSFILLACCLIPVTFSHSLWLGVISLTDVSVTVPDSSESVLSDSELSGPDSSSLLELLLESGSGSGLFWTFFF